MTAAPRGPVEERFRGARRDPHRAVLGGFHPVKHAVRFGADLEEVVVHDREGALRLADSLAPDLRPTLEGADVLSQESFEALTPSPPGSGVLAIARRRAWSVDDVLPGEAPAVLLERPGNLGNIGAVIRNAAGLGARGVLVVGEHDPWHPDAVKGAAGLQYAVPVVSVHRLGDLPLPDPGAPVVGVDPGGAPLRPGAIPPGAVLAFGAEREGLSGELRELAREALAIPMREGVSSLNLASTVGIGLFTWTLGRGRD